jgi:Icc protein
MQEGDVTRGRDRPAEKCFRLIQISDPHLPAEPDGWLKAGVRPEARLARICSALAEEEKPDCLLLTGDLAHEGTPDSYRRLARLMARTAIPWYVLAGNHDDERFMRGFFGESLMPRRIHLGPWRILLLNTAWPGHVEGRLDPGDRAAMVEVLVHEPPVPTLVALHHPPVTTGTAWLDAIGLSGDRNWLNPIHGSPVRAVLFGHIHAAFETVAGGIRYYGAPSSAMQFVLGRSDLAIETGWGGWRSYRLWPDGRIDSRVHPIPFEGGI